MKSACRDKRKLKTLFGSSDANIGLLPGDSFFVVDLDGEEAIAIFEELLREHPLPPTPIAKSGGGGRHYYFGKDDRIKTGYKLRGCIDILTTKSPVVAPPSIHHSGNAYEWIVSPSEADLSDAPEWLVDWILGLVAERKKEKKKDRSSEQQSSFQFEDQDLATALGVDSGRNDQLCRLVGIHLASKGDTPDLLRLATDWGKRCDPPMESKLVEKKVANLVAKHLTNNPQDSEAEEDESSSEMAVSSFDSINAKEISWLWEGRFALGKITLLTGDGGVGKSMLTCDMASRISTGKDFPDGLPCSLGDSFFIAGEDGAEDTIRPRLDAAGADVSRVHLIQGPIPKGEKYASPVDLSRHIGKLDRMLEGYPEAKLLVVDPIMDYLGAATNSDKATDVRRVLSPLRELAEKHQIAIVAMNHLNKRVGGSSKSRSLGSGAFVQVARIELRVVEDPEDADRRLLLSVKNNLGASPGLAYRIESGRE